MFDPFIEETPPHVRRNVENMVNDKIVPPNNLKLLDELLTNTSHNSRTNFGHKLVPSSIWLELGHGTRKDKKWVHH